MRRFAKNPVSLGPSLRFCRVFTGKTAKSAIEFSISVKGDRLFPLSYFLDGKGDRTFYQIPSLWADSRSDNSFSEG
ncbi:MAG: hypothetical protein WCD53_26225 [Microcoleus sp.]